MAKKTSRRTAKASSARGKPARKVSTDATAERPAREAANSEPARGSGIPHELQPIVRHRSSVDLLALYNAACLLHQKRETELHLGRPTVRGMQRERMDAEASAYFARVAKCLGRSADYLRTLARWRDAWPTPEEFEEEIVKPTGPEGYKLRQSHVLLLAALSQTSAQVDLRRKLTEQAIQNAWTRDELWRHIRENRKHLETPKKKARSKSRHPLDEADAMFGSAW